MDVTSNVNIKKMNFFQSAFALFILLNALAFSLATHAQSQNLLARLAPNESGSYLRSDCQWVFTQTNVGIDFYDLRCSNIRVAILELNTSSSSLVGYQCRLNATHDNVIASGQHNNDCNIEATQNGPLALPTATPIPTITPIPTPTPSPEPSPYAQPFVWLDRFSSNGEVDVVLNPSNLSVADYGSWEFQYLRTNSTSPNWKDSAVETQTVARQSDQITHRIRLETPAPSASNNIRYRYAFRAREYAPARTDGSGPCNDILYPVGPCHQPWGAGDSILVGPTPTPVPTATPYPLSFTVSQPSPTPTVLPAITSQNGESIASPAMEEYTIYYGDFNSDGRFNDIYFAGKDTFVLIAGDINIPLFITQRDFVYYQNSDGSHQQAVEITPTSSTLASATLLTLGQDYFIQNFDADGIPDFLIRGKTVHDVTLMLSGVPDFAEAFPDIIADFTGDRALDYNLSDRNLLLDFVDYNNQNIVDIRVRSTSGGAGTVVYVGNPSVSVEDDFHYDYGYDALDRLRKVRLNEQDRTSYDYDPAGNRTSVEELGN